MTGKADFSEQEWKQILEGPTSAEHVAEARKEGFLGLGGERVSEEERTALADIEAALG